MAEATQSTRRSPVPHPNPHQVASAPSASVNGARVRRWGLVGLSAVLGIIGIVGSLWVWVQAVPLVPSRTVTIALEESLPVSEEERRAALERLGLDIPDVPMDLTRTSNGPGAGGWSVPDGLASQHRVAARIALSLGTDPAIVEHQRRADLRRGLAHLTIALRAAPGDGYGWYWRAVMMHFLHPDDHEAIEASLEMSATVLPYAPVLTGPRALFWLQMAVRRSLDDQDLAARPIDPMVGFPITTSRRFERQMEFAFAREPDALAVAAARYHVIPTLRRILTDRAVDPDAIDRALGPAR